jgi:hypothetical protein
MLDSQRVVNLLPKLNVCLDFVRKRWRSVHFQPKEYQQQSTSSDEAFVGFWSPTPEVIRPPSFEIHCPFYFP